MRGIRRTLFKLDTEVIVSRSSVPLSCCVFLTLADSCMPNLDGWQCFSASQSNFASVAAHCFLRS